MQQVRIEAETRDGRGKGAARSLRRAGRLPAVVYGAGEEARPIDIDTRAFRDAIVNEAADRALISLTVGGERLLAIVKEVQQHPVWRDLLHVDFQSIRMDQEITIEAVVDLQGEPVGIAEGGVLENPAHSLQIRVLPGNIPDAIVVDVSEWNIGDGIHVSELILPEGVEVVDPPETLVAQVIIPRIIELDEIVPEEEIEGELAEGEEAPEGEGDGEDAEAGDDDDDDA
ncbi:50S ribosomal protein L25 [Candidatus Poribacteria bacterium]|jgi:large subunit ribosomal protein L25|nr:50S ribosomal protein L25 [Candidatus Poribacteria bacterium]MBT5537147.1 50S ribosomal protein L25 [Candidatus Poribacteria bacterium]MBT5713503.1 50S ribosomal protein L25 [Candidatus Poribacteria bacterium]MBT7097895.1 50S ribosomal protein L25 [Candidatus Poribacteria bacterium]MBT7808286.1 50S ribosomal protein L25 [Candidatus Poribacteria bacterium]